MVPDAGFEGTEGGEGFGRRDSVGVGDGGGGGGRGGGSWGLGRRNMIGCCCYVFHFLESGEYDDVSDGYGERSVLVVVALAIGRSSSAVVGRHSRLPALVAPSCSQAYHGKLIVRLTRYCERRPD